MGEAEAKAKAEKCREVEEERDEAERRRREEAARHEFKCQQNEILAKAQFAQQQEDKQHCLQLKNDRIVKVRNSGNRSCRRGKPQRIDLKLSVSKNFDFRLKEK
jgi:hypothetical protein